jgi:hypothetical protein
MTDKAIGGKMSKGRKILLAAVVLAVVLALPVAVQADPPLKYLHAKGGSINSTLTDPVGTDWHELYPTFCTNYTLGRWVDNVDGILSYCDFIEMNQKPDGPVEWYHVEEVTITLKVTPPGSPEPIMYIEHKGGYDPDVITNPVGTQWHEIYPDFCTQYVITYKYYTDKLEPGAWIDTAQGSWMVEEVAIDIIVAPGQPPPVGGEAYPVNKMSLLAPWIGLAALLAGGTSWLTLRRRRAQS